MKGRVFSIEEFSTFDGPGIRATVFMKGCPLSCSWCHNPEGKSGAVEYVRNPNGCARCGACERAGIVCNGRLMLTKESISACPRGLVRRCGEDYTPQEMTDKLLKLAPILSQSGGGVTFSGGEPLRQADFVRACFRLLDGKLHRAIQTSGYANGEVFESVLRECDYVLYDLKVMDGGKHLRYCGVDNGQILANYRTLTQSGVDFVTRVPLIPTVTDTQENLEAIAAFVSSLGVRYVELLPYNKLAGSKYASVLREYKPDFDDTVPCLTNTEIFEKYGVTAKVM